MGEAVQGDWKQLSDPTFQACLDVTHDFHDAGFFRYFVAPGELLIDLHPVYFAEIREHSYDSMNACQFRLAVDHHLPEASLSKAHKDFDLYRLQLDGQRLKFSFEGCDLDVVVDPSKSCFRFHFIPKELDYWSETI